MVQLYDHDVPVVAPERVNDDETHLFTSLVSSWA
jgi:hypothetical protein